MKHVIIKFVFQERNMGIDCWPDKCDVSSITNILVSRIEVERKLPNRNGESYRYKNEDEQCTEKLFKSEITGTPDANYSVHETCKVWFWVFILRNALFAKLKFITELNSVRLLIKQPTLVERDDESQRRERH